MTQRDNTLVAVEQIIDDIAVAFTDCHRPELVQMRKDVMRRFYERLRLAGQDRGPITLAQVEADMLKLMEDSKDRPGLPIGEWIAEDIEGDQGDVEKVVRDQLSKWQDEIAEDDI